ncbi:MAG: ABC transporter substrate-binding protein [Pyrinomonadaceae bacterium]
MEYLKENASRKFLVYGIVATVLAFGGLSCGDVVSNAPNIPQRRLTDDLGRDVLLPTVVKRAVSVAPSLTENIFAVGAGDRLVGVTTYCDYPDAAKTIAKVGDTQTPSVETIIALRPDVVFVSTASQLEAFTQTLANQNIAVFVIDADSFEAVLKNLRTLGEIFGTQDKADALMKELEMRASAVNSKYNDSPPVRVFVQISREPLYTVGQGSFLTEIVERAHGDLVTNDIEKSFPVISKERALAINPAAIILSDSSDNAEPNAAFINSPAVKNGRVYRINADIISRPGPRLVDALEEIAADLHRK